MPPAGASAPTRPATANSVTTYGSMSMNWLGTGDPITENTPCRFVANPNSSAASVARIGSHLPKMSAASAMYPAPPVISRPN